MRRHLVLVTLAVMLGPLGVACGQGHEHGGRTNAGAIRKVPGNFEIKAMRGTRVSFPSLAGNAGGYLSLPDGKGVKHPAIIVIQEWWGVNEWVIQETDRLAKNGYVALAVDLYRGKVATTPETAHELMRGMPEDRALADLQSGFKLLAARKDVDATRIGVIGWCMGGGYALNLALAEPHLSALSMNYGHLASDPASIARLHAPLLGNFGALDQGIPAEDVRAFDAALKRAGKSSDIRIYEAAGHGFMNPNNKDGYVKTAAEDAQERIDRFFARTLNP
ncbi:MAG: dienelactone hydrolase family protein [Acidobacteriota bacterium]